MKDKIVCVFTDSDNKVQMRVWRNNKLDKYIFFNLIEQCKSYEDALDEGKNGFDLLSQMAIIRTLRATINGGKADNRYCDKCWHRFECWTK
jgi:hypothetical protein